MRISRLFAYAFAAFAFLTLGSLMLIVSLHVLSMEDALLKVEELYEKPWQSVRMGISGLFFVVLGLVFSKFFVKSLKPSDDLILYGKWGHLNVSVRTISDLLRRVLKKYESIRLINVDVAASGNQLKVEANLVLLSEWGLPDLSSKIREEMIKRLKQILGAEVELDLVLNIRGVIEEPELAETGAHL